MAEDLQTAARRELCDSSRFLFFDDSPTVLASSFEVDTADLRPLMAAVGEREAAMKQGMVIQGTRYELHQHHPPLAYGRTMSGDPETSEGAAICRVEDGLGGRACYGVITYQMPNLSARMVPLLQAFCQQHLRIGAPPRQEQQQR